jgi:hypothetical protein
MHSLAASLLKQDRDRCILWNVGRKLHGGVPTAVGYAYGLRKSKTSNTVEKTASYRHNFFSYQTMVMFCERRNDHNYPEKIKSGFAT